MTDRLFFADLEEIFQQVEKPGRYIGGEWNSTMKDWKGKVSVALVFPDVYEVGMSNVGLKILYHIVNDLDWAVAERAYSPWLDMEKKMREHDIPLYTLESFTPLNQFDVVGFSLQYELSYTNVLNALDLSGIPVKSERRTENDPLVVAGGPNAFTPEPLAEFIDIFLIGEAETGFIELLKSVNSGCPKKADRETLLKQVANINGMYVPAFYQEIRGKEGYLGVAPVSADVPKTIKKRIMKDLDETPFPVQTVVPNIDIIHNRGFVELFRGCTRGCRFCQAGILYRPVRERSLKKNFEVAEQIYRETGYEELSLTSLSTSDYRGIDALLDSLDASLDLGQISVSLPSLRVDAFSVELAEKVQQGRKTGLTFAPEAGTERLRQVINKQILDEDLIRAVEAAFTSGWDKIKLYFMLGLPTETDEDAMGIVELAEKVIDTYKKITGKKKLKLNISVSTFIPKPHTPFQWISLESEENIKRRQKLLKKHLNHPAVDVDWDPFCPSVLETFLARGGRKTGEVIYRAFLSGARFDGWDDQFNFETWQKAFQQAGVEPDDHVFRAYELNEILPWDHISPGISKEYLKQEYQKAMVPETTPDCSFDTKSCSNCGVCFDLRVLPQRKGW